MAKSQTTSEPANMRPLEDVPEAIKLLDEFEVPTQNEQGDPMPLSQRVAYLIEIAAERMMQRPDQLYQDALADRLRADRIELERKTAELDKELDEIEEDLEIKRHAFAEAKCQIAAIDAWLAQHPEEQS